MARMISAQVRNRKGFTLIEQVVTIASIAVTAAVVVPGVFKQLSKSEVNRMAQDLRSVQQATATFRSNTSAWPGEIEHLRTAIVATTDLDALERGYTTDAANGWAGPYVESARFTATGLLASAASSNFVNTITYSYFRPGGATGERGRYLVLQIDGVSIESAEAVSRQVDGEDDVTLALATTLASVTDVAVGDNDAAAADKNALGRVRWFDSGTADDGIGTLVYLGSTVD